jgi:hypothetical protein
MSNTTKSTIPASKKGMAFSAFIIAPKAGGKGWSGS